MQNNITPSGRYLIKILKLCEGYRALILPPQMPVRFSLCTVLRMSVCEVAISPIQLSLSSPILQELSLLPLMEPVITANFNLFCPFGSSPINGKSQLKGSFGNAALDSIPDYYSQLLTKVRPVLCLFSQPAGLAQVAWGKDMAEWGGGGDTLLECFSLPWISIMQT